jgi:hypothetical protein
MYDPRIGRFFAVDPLAPDYPWNSPYSFQENKLGLGTELEGRELKEFKKYIAGVIDGFEALLDNETHEEVKRKMQIVRTTDPNKKDQIEAEGKSKTAEAQRKITVNAKKALPAGIKAAADVVEITGDAIEIAGIATANPPLMAAGAAIGTVGASVNLAVDVVAGDPTEGFINFGLSFGFGAIGKQGAKAVNNNVSKAIIAGSVKANQEVSKKVVKKQMKASDISILPKSERKK